MYVYICIYFVYVSKSLMRRVCVEVLKFLEYTIKQKRNPFILRLAANNRLENTHREDIAHTNIRDHELNFSLHTHTHNIYISIYTFFC